MENQRERHPRRDPARTRRQALTAARVLVASRGAAVNLQQVATAAGISKSGLVHHFATIEELFAALAEDVYLEFSARVDACTEASDLAPGRVMRGYIRATFDALISGAGNTDELDSIYAHLGAIPAVAAVSHAQGTAWESKLSADGFDRERARLLLLACSGAEVHAGFGHIPGGSLVAIRDQLLAATH